MVSDELKSNLVQELHSASERRVIWTGEPQVDKVEDVGEEEDDVGEAEAGQQVVEHARHVPPIIQDLLSTMITIVDGNLIHVAHACRKISLFGLRLCDYSRSYQIH